MSMMYEVTLEDGRTLKVMADFVDVLDGPSRCVRFVRQRPDDEAVVHAVYFGVKSVEFIGFVDTSRPAVKRKKEKK